VGSNPTLSANQLLPALIVHREDML